MGMAEYNFWVARRWIRQVWGVTKAGLNEETKGINKAAKRKEKDTMVVVVDDVMGVFAVEGC